MIRQQVGDIFEVDYQRRRYYVIILTKRVMFGGNIVFAYHNNGAEMDLAGLARLDAGFNICTDLLYFKRAGAVRRIGKLVSVERFFRTRYMKLTMTSHGEKASRWHIYSLEDLGKRLCSIDGELPDEYRSAMDGGTYSFDLVAAKILDRYTPDLDDRL